VSADNIHQLRALEMLVKQLREENARLKRGKLPDGIPDCWEVVERFEDATPMGLDADGAEMRAGVHEGRRTAEAWTHDDLAQWVRCVCPTQDEVYVLRYRDNYDHRCGQEWALCSLGFKDEGDGTWRRSRK